MNDQLPAVFRHPGRTLRLMLSGRTDEFGLEGDPLADAHAVVEALALPSTLIRPLVCELTTVTLAGPDPERKTQLRRQTWSLVSTTLPIDARGRCGAVAEERRAPTLTPSVIGRWIEDALASASEGGRGLWDDLVIPVCAARVPSELARVTGDTLALAEDGGVLDAQVTHEPPEAWATGPHGPAERPPIGVVFSIMPAALMLDIEVDWNLWWNESGPGADLSVWVADLRSIGWV